MKYWFVFALIVEIVFAFQCVDLRKFCQRGSNSTLIFFDNGPNSTKSGCHYWPASETPFKWRFAGGPMMARQVILAWYMCSFVIFLGNLDQYR